MAEFQYQLYLDLFQAYLQYLILEFTMHLESFYIVCLHQYEDSIDLLWAFDHYQIHDSFISFLSKSFRIIIFDYSILSIIRLFFDNFIHCLLELVL